MNIIIQPSRPFNEYPDTKEKDMASFRNAVVALENLGWRHLLISLTDDGIMMGSPNKESLEWRHTISDQKFQNPNKRRELEDRLTGMMLEPHVRNEIIDRILK